MDGAQVASLTKRLLTLHFLPVAQGDKYGAATKDAVIAFQKCEGLPRTGVVDSQTQARLRTAHTPTPLLADRPGRRIEVSLSKQVALEVSHGRVLWAIHVSTGRPGLETPLGRFSVQSRSTRAWSAEYHDWLPYASFFYNGYGLHGFASVPLHPASHGCVRVPLEYAPLLYGFDTIGTEIDVID